VRKRRVIVYEDDPDVANILKERFMLRGYEVLTHQEPVNCPAYDDIAVCKELYPCADIILVDLSLPRMNGIDMLRVQSLNGCRVPAGSKALMSGDLDEREQRDIEELGCAYFQKPFSFGEIQRGSTSARSRWTCRSPWA
jgi:DNA-binding response OmpR family regulator